MPMVSAGMRNGRYVVLFLFLAAIIVQGCSAVDNRIQERQAEFNTYPPEIQGLIKTGQIRPGFTETQVYIAWGEPYYRGSGQWTYPGFDCKKFQVPKDDYEYKRQYEDEWEDYQEKKKKGQKAVFVPPSRFKDESRCRRYVKNYLYFSNGILTRMDSPPAITWIDRDWDVRR